MVVLVVCSQCKEDVRPLEKQIYRVINGRPWCERCLPVHGEK